MNTPRNTTGASMKAALALNPIAFAITLLPVVLLAQPAQNTTSADNAGARTLFETTGQADIGSRPFSSFLERLSSPADKISIEPAGDNLAADGVSGTDVRVRLLDKNGQAIKGEHIVTIEVNGGARILLPGRLTSESGADRGDIDRITPGVQAKVVDGQLSFKLIAPYQPDLVQLRVSLAGVTQRIDVRYVPDLREMIAVGLIEGRLRSDKFDPRTIEAARENDGFDQELRGFTREFNGGRTNFGARAALYLKGKIKGEYLITAAYDSDKDTRKQLFESIDPNAFYPIYGDSSTRTQDAQSSGKLYVRLDKGRSFLLWGDYTTQDPNPARRLGQYNRTLPGFKGRYDEGDLTVNVFAAQESFKQFVDEFAARGVSGPYSVSNHNGVKGTERIEIIVRDRFQTSNILKVTPLTRSVDYEFEPFDGKILFRAAIPSVDDQLNPVSIRVTYEVETGGERYMVYGADAKLKLTSALTVGIAAAHNKNPATPETVTGVNLSLKLSKNTEVIAEVARSSTLVNVLGNSHSTNNSANFIGKSGEVNGQASRIEIRHADENLRGNVFVQKADNDFNNASSGLTGGKQAAGAAATYKATDSITITGDYKRDRDVVIGSQNDAASLAADLKVSSKLSIGAGVRHVEQNAFSVAQQAVSNCTTDPTKNTYGGSLPGYNTGYGISQVGNQQIDPATGLPVVCTTTVNTLPTPAQALSRNSAFVRGTFKATDDLSINGELQNITGTDPARTAKLGLKYAATNRLNLTGEVQREFNGTSGHNNDLYRVGADWKVADKTRVYSRYEYAHAYGGAYGLGTGPLTRAFATGIDTQYMQDGALFSEYRLSDTGSGRTIHNAIGLRNGWNISEGLRLTTNAERLLSSAGNSTALGLGAEYTGSELWKGSGRIQWRQDSTYTNWLATMALARKLDRNWTAIVRDYYSLTDPRNGDPDTKQNRFQFGFAYRPVDNNKFDALGMYERKTELVPGTTDSLKNIISLRANYHPTRPWWLSGRLAYKQVKELLAGTVHDSYHASLVGGRVTYDITNRWSLGAITTLLVGQGGARQYAYGLEVGYTVMDNLIVGLGYNWRGFSDSELTGNDYSNRGWVLNMRYKFDEDIFKSSDRSINRTLDPQGAPSIGTGAGTPLPAAPKR